ncbi:AraC family transcriptional regulator N-terminal domain-containing protein [Marinobacter sp.]|uniref:AraC family transcriptional regulator N-terminal domain-containing protein n=1 Tax=Marinobacter sp. TaxID=50741 RepID=UPI00345BDB19
MVAQLLTEHPGSRRTGLIRTTQPVTCVWRHQPILYDPVIRLLHLLDQPQDREVLEPLVRREYLLASVAPPGKDRDMMRSSVAIETWPNKPEAFSPTNTPSPH